MGRSGTEPGGGCHAVGNAGGLALLGEGPFVGLCRRGLFSLENG